MMENLTDQLKLKTREKHQKVEKSLLNLLKAIRSVPDYLHVLQIFYTYYGPLELLIDQFVDDQVLPDYSKRRKSAILTEEIRSLGKTPDDPKSRFIPRVTDLDGAFGAMYVMEGSTLGGTHIAAILGKNHPELAPHILFFNGYGVETELMWEKFKGIINHISADQQRWASTIHTADETFENFYNHIRANT